MSQNPLTPLNPNLAMPMPAAAGPTRFKTVDPVRLVREHLALLIVMSVVSVTLGVGTWFVLNMFAPKFTSRGQLVVTGGLAEAYGAPTEVTATPTQGNMDILEAYMNTQVLLIKSQQILNGALDNASVKKTRWYSQFDDMSEARDDLEKERLGVSTVRDSNMISLSISVRHKEDASPILTAVIQSYMKAMRDQNTDQYDDVRETFNSERRAAELALEQIRKRIEDFARQYNIGGTDMANRFEKSAIEYSFLSTEAAKLRILLSSANELVASAVEALRNESYSPEIRQQVELVPSVLNRDEEIRQLRETREVLLQRVGPQHQQVRDIDLRIKVVEQERNAEMNRLLREALQVRLGQAQAERDNLAAQVADMEARLEQAGTRMRELQVYQQQFQQMKEDEFLAKERLTRSDQVLDELKLRVSRPDSTRVRLASAPGEAEQTFPKWYVVIPAVVFLVFGGTVGLLFLKELVDQRVKSPSDLALIPDADCLSVVPDSREDAEGPRQIEGVVQTDPKGLMAESFRQLRTAVMNRMERRGYKSLMVTCAQPESGVSSVINNLAISIACQGKKVLVIDANIRRPIQHRLFNTPAVPGLVEVLRGSAMVDSAVNPQDGTGLVEVIRSSITMDAPQMPNGTGLNVLPAGDVSNASPELLEGPAFRNLLNQFENEYDLVLVDTPPMLVASDAVMLARCVDASLLVVRAPSDRRGMIGRLVRQLEGQRADLIGVTLNGARSSRGGYFRENFRQFYRYHKQSPRALPSPVGAGTEA